MESVNKRQQAEFIIAHSKDINYAGVTPLEELEPKLYAELVSLGATFHDNEQYMKTRAHQNVCGPYVTIFHESAIQRHWGPQSWTTVFILPTHREKEGKRYDAGCWHEQGEGVPPTWGEFLGTKEWMEQTNRQSEVFLWGNEQWTSMPQQGKRATLLKPYTQDANTLFQKQILGIHPELAIHWDRIYPMYVGALEEHAPTGIPHLELVAAVEKAIGKGKDKIIFSNADEALQPQSIQRVHRIIDAIDYMPTSSWFMLTATLNGTESYKKICRLIGCEPKMQIISGHRFENVVKDTMYMEHPERSQDFTEHPYWKGKEYQIGKRKKKLLCFNRMPRWQRARMVGFLFEHNLIMDSYVSFDLSQNAEMFYQQDAWDLKNSSLIDEEYREEPYFDNIFKYWHRLPLVLNRTVERDNPVDINLDDLQYFDNSYFSVVNETNFYQCMTGDTGGRPISCVHTDGVFISEKLYKPIAHRHPFIVAGVPGTLKYLKLAGYQTFAGIIDESYDNIQDDNARLDALESEVLRLANLSDDEWLEMQKVLKPIIDHNYNHLLRIKKLSTTDYDLVGDFFKG